MLFFNVIKPKISQLFCLIVCVPGKQVYALPVLALPSEAHKIIICFVYLQFFSTHTQDLCVHLKWKSYNTILQLVNLKR